MTCAEKKTLLAAYQSAAEDFAESVDRLHRTRVTSAHVKYETIRLRSEEARLISEKARVALEEHVVNHGC